MRMDLNVAQRLARNNVDNGDEVAARFREARMTSFLSIARTVASVTNGILGLMSLTLPDVSAPFRRELNLDRIAENDTPPSNATAPVLRALASDNNPEWYTRSSKLAAKELVDLSSPYCSRRIRNESRLRNS